MRQKITEKLPGLLCCLLFGVIVFSQPVRGQSISLDNIYKRFLIIGIDNKVEVKLNGYSFDRVDVSLSGKARLNGSAGKYTIRLDSAARQGDSIILLVKDKKKTVLKRFKLIAAYAPKPNPGLCGIVFSKNANNELLISKADLMKIDSLCFDMTGDKYGIVPMLMRIQSFSVQCFPARGKTMEFTSSGNRADKDAMVAFGNLVSGDWLIFNPILVYNKPFGITAELPPLVIRIR